MKKRIITEMARMRQLAGILSEVKVEGGELEATLREFDMLHAKYHEAKKKFEALETEFRVSEDKVRVALEGMDETEQKILELEDIAVRIKVAGATKTTFPYKLIAETLYTKVNSTLKALIDQLMADESKVHKVKSQIELKRGKVDETFSLSGALSKAGQYVSDIFQKLGNYIKGENRRLQGYIDELNDELQGVI